MQIEKNFVVRAAPGAVWALLTDPHRVAGCLPGAAITDQVDERTYTGTITVKVGPVSTSYKGKVRFERLDPGARTAEIVASGQDVRGKGGADLRMTSRLVERTPAETEVTVLSEVSITGILAQMGRGMIQDVTDQMFERFTAAVRTELEAVGSAADAAPGRGEAVSAEPIQAVSLGAQVAGRALGRAVRRRGVGVVIILVLLVIWWLWFR